MSEYYKHTKLKLTTFIYINTHNMFNNKLNIMQLEFNHSGKLWMPLHRNNKLGTHATT